MKKQILIVDDEPHIVTSLRFLMEKAGHEVAAVGNGANALELLETIRPDLILLDLMMPKVDGFEVCRRIRADGDEVKIIMLSARGQETEIQQALAIGADAYITKPFSTADVVAQVDQLLTDE